MTPTLAAAFVNLLKADSAVTAICGLRIFPEIAPDKTPTPYVVWLEISTDTEESHDDAEGLDATDVQFSCYASDPLAAISLRKAVRHALLTTPIDGVKVIQPVLRSLPESALRLSNSVLDITFMHNPTT
jgi:hypothetical protein